MSFPDTKSGSGITHSIRQKESTLSRNIVGLWKLWQKSKKTAPFQRMSTTETVPKGEHEDNYLIWLFAIKSRRSLALIPVSAII